MVKSKSKLKANVEIPRNLDQFPEPHEISAAWVLADYFDTEVVFLRCRTGYRQHSADVEISGAEWEIKSPKSDNLKKVKENLADAAHQAKYATIDLRRTSIPDDTLIEFLTKLSKTKRTIKWVLAIVKTGEVVEIYKKSRL